VSNESRPQRFGLAQLLRGIFSLRGSDVDWQFSPEFSAGFELEASTDARPEHSYLRGEFLKWGRCGVGALAANVSMAGLWNPPGSNVIVVLDRATVFTNGGGNQLPLTYEDLAAAPGAGVFLPQPRDLKGGQMNPGGVSRMLTHQQGAARGQQAYDVLISVSQQCLPAPIVLRPGAAIWFNTAAVNFSIAVAMMWRERPAQAGEL
jgi:hypothetical protein